MNADDRRRYVPHIRNLVKLFTVYDRFAFKCQITQKLRESGVKLVTPESLLDDPSTKRMCGLLISGDGKQIAFHMMERWNREITSDNHLNFLKTFEHHLCHLIYYLWGDDVDLDNNADPHTPLYLSTTAEFFSNKIAMTKSSGKLAFNLPTTVFDLPSYTYTSNSCNIDALLTVLLFSKPSIFRDALLHSDGNAENFVQNDKGEIVACIFGDNVVSHERFRDFRDMFQFSLIREFKYLLSKRRITSSLSRDALSKCFPDMKTGRGVWKFYSASELYDLIANMFPTQLLPDRKKSIVMFSEIDEHKIPSTQNLVVLRNNGAQKLDSSALDKSFTKFASIHLISSAHYVAFFVAPNGKWYFYDDISTPSPAKSIPNFEIGVAELVFFYRNNVR